MKLVIASDHGGYILKDALVKHLRSKNVECEDLGVSSEDSVDYPDFAEDVAARVSSGKADRGILVCGTGIGMAITANKFKGVRAAVVTDEYTARMSMEHNDANIIALGGRVLDEKTAIGMVDAWLDTQFAGGRHERRLKKIEQIEAKNFK